MKCVIGIDPSLTSFALARSVLRKREWFTDVHVFKSKSPGKKAPVEARMRRIDDLVLNALKVIQEIRPKVIVIEGYAYGANTAGVYLGELGGILRKCLLPMTDHLVEVAPTTLKKFVTGKGNANKTQMVSTIASKYNLVLKTDDEADAYGLMEMAKVLAGFEEGTKQEKEVLKKVGG